MKTTNGILGLWLAAALAVGTTQAVHADDSLEQVKKAGTVNVGIAQEPPYAFITSEGKVTGASIDLNRAIFKKMGLGELKAETTDFAGLIPGIQARRFDIISTGLIIRPARCEAVLFSQPDLCTGEGFAVKKGNPLGLKSYDDVKAGTARLAVCGSCAEEKRALELGVPRDRLVIASDAFNAIKMLQAGRVDAVAWPDATLTDIINTLKDEELEVFSPIQGEPVSCSGVAFNKDARAFRDAYDVAFAELKASGEYAKIVSPYGFDPALTLATNRDQYCGGKAN
jgi:polar amino acid transport system substrate-binding protein